MARTQGFDDVWRDHHGYLRGMAGRMLGRSADADDVVQEAFSRLARVELEEIDDVRGWLAVVVRRLCLDRIRSAYSRHESVTGDLSPTVSGHGPADPADRTTLDDEVQLALAIVLDRLSPAERTAFVLHDVFGFSFVAVGEIVGRTPAACRQLASRARRSIRSGSESNPPEVAITEQRILAERFIAACAGGDIGELMAVLDPDVVGEATLLGRGPLVRLEGRALVAQRLLGLFGPGTGSTLMPITIEDRPGAVVFTHRRLAAVIRLDDEEGRIHHIRSWVRPPV